MFRIAMKPELDDAGSHSGHRPPVVRLEAELNEVQLVPGSLPGSLRKIPQDIQCPANPAKLFRHR